MEDLTILLKTILSQNGGWMVLITAITMIAAIVIVAIIFLTRGAKSLGERVADSVDKRSDVRLKELEIRREELKIQKTLVAASAESISTLGNLAKEKTHTKGVVVIKLTRKPKYKSRNESLNSDINKTRKAAHALPKHRGGFSR